MAGTVDLPEAHAKALAHTGTLVAGVSAPQLAEPSNLEGWDVRVLLNHVVGGNFWVPELVGGRTIAEVGDRLDGDVLGEHPIDAYAGSEQVAAAAFREPGAMDRPVAVSYGPVPGSVYCGHRLIDVLIHGWDIAVSTGQDPALPADLVEACWAVADAEREELAASGAFGTEVSVPADADQQTKLLAVLGRAA